MERDNSKDYPEETVSFKSECFQLESHIFYRGGTNDYSKDGTSIHKIVNNKGIVVEGVWMDAWQEISPGIKTRIEKGNCQVRIYRSACPVRVLYHDFYEYISYDHYEHCSSSSNFYWIRYESDSGNSSKTKLNTKPGSK